LERIRAHLAKHPHDTAAETAKALGVSRQRIHQAAKKYGINYPGAGLPALRRFECPNCGLEAWTLPNAWLICGVCRSGSGQIVEMRPAE
jgi:hypothetical protein